MDARADLGLRWVYVTVVGVDVLRLILQSMCIKMNKKKTVCHYFNFLSFVLVKFHSDSLYHCVITE